MLKIPVLFWFFFSPDTFVGHKGWFNYCSFVKKLALLRVRCVVIQTCECVSGTRLAMLTSGVTFIFLCSTAVLLGMQLDSLFQES